jgi:hypothetical protein
VGARSAISGDLLSTVISIHYILGFRKDNPNVFNTLIQDLSIASGIKMHMLLILLTLCLRKPDGISRLFSIAYTAAGNGWRAVDATAVRDLTTSFVVLLKVVMTW